MVDAQQAWVCSQSSLTGGLRVQTWGHRAWQLQSYKAAMPCKAGCTGLPCIDQDTERAGWAADSSKPVMMPASGLNRFSSIVLQRCMLAAPSRSVLPLHGHAGKLHADGFCLAS